MVIQDITRPRNTLPAGGRGCPELCGWWDRRKPPAAVRLYSGHEPEDAVNKAKGGSCWPLLDKATLTPSPKIMGNSCEATPQTPKPRAEELARDYRTDVFLLQ